MLSMSIYVALIQVFIEQIESLKSNPSYMTKWEIKDGLVSL
jgi:hypothetical protein